MLHKKLIVFLIGLCVLLAPVLSNVTLLLPVPTAHAHDQAVDCHFTKSGDSSHSNSPKVTHSCCFNFVGSLSATNLIQPLQGISEIIPFNPSLSLTSRIEGLFRPPRQNSRSA